MTPSELLVAVFALVTRGFATRQNRHRFGELELTMLNEHAEEIAMLRVVEDESSWRVDLYAAGMIQSLSMLQARRCRHPVIPENCWALLWHTGGGGPTFYATADRGEVTLCTALSQHELIGAVKLAGWRCALDWLRTAVRGHWESEA